MIDLNDQNFQGEVLNGDNDKPFLVDFWTNWCVPCKVIAPFIEKIAEDYRDKIKVGRLNVDESKQTAITYGIEAIPTLIIFKQGQIVDKVIGVVPYQVLIQKIEQHI
ncbi:thioredoxin [Candidatus Parcubacteria bacterium]|nr:thioredoxin [Candidatus Parcubacteria bacterium]